MQTPAHVRLPFALAAAVALLLGFPAAAAASPYLTGDWEYFQAFSLDNSGNANPVTDFVLALEIDTETLVSQGKMQSNGEDLRFSVGNDACDYWIQKDFNTANTVVWVRVPEVPANDTVDLEMYYANPNASDAQEPDDVFLLWDDFSGSQPDPNKWTVHGTPSTSTVHNGYWEFTGANNWEYFESLDSFDVPVVVHYTADGSGSGASAGFILGSDTDHNRYTFRGTGGNVGTTHDSNVSGGNAWADSSYPGTSFHANAVYEYRVRTELNGSDLHIEEFDNLTTSESAPGPQMFTNRAINELTVGGSSWGLTLYMHEIFVYEDLAVTPSVGSSSGEQPVATPVVTVPGPQTVDEAEPLTFSGATAITVDDPTGGTTDLHVELSVDFGTLTLGSTAGLSNLSGDGSETVEFVGTDSQVTAALNGLTYNSETLPPADSTTLSVEAHNPNRGLTGEREVEINVMLLNHPPTIEASSSTLRTRPRMDFVFGEESLSLTFDDPDALPEDELELAVAWEGDALGPLTVPDDDGLDLIDGSLEESESFTVHGTLASLNAAVDGMIFHAESIGNGQLAITLDDRGHNGSDGPKSTVLLLEITVSRSLTSGSSGCVTATDPTRHGLPALPLGLALASLLLLAGRGPRPTPKPTT